METSIEVYNAARAYDLTLGATHYERPGSLKCLNGSIDAFKLVDGTTQLIGQIPTLACNNPQTVTASTIDDFAKKHGLSKRPDIASCPTMATVIDQPTHDLLVAKGWTVNPHLIESPKGMLISFVGKIPNRHVTMTSTGNEVILSMIECAGTKETAKINLDTDAITMMP
jgi:hypothetical protein